MTGTNWLTVTSTGHQFQEAIFLIWYGGDPGPGNSLGRVKFMFPNGYNVYIHDTPSKSFFPVMEGLTVQVV